jgi:hypothetical protein
MGEEKKVCKVLVGKPIRKTPLGTLQYKWGDGIRMDFREIDWGCRVGSVGLG